VVIKTRYFNTNSSKNTFFFFMSYMKQTKCFGMDVYRVNNFNSECKS
jgi:hypothetical protein